jgi:hypothetical protein
VSTLAQACQMTVFTTAPDNFKTPQGAVDRSRSGHGGLRCLELDGEEEFGEGLRDPMSLMRYALKLWTGDLHEGGAYLPH